MTAAAESIPSGSGMKPVPWRELVAFLRDDPFVLVMFLSLLLIGADKVSISVAGLTLRMVFPLLMVSFGLLYIQRAATITIPVRLAFLFFLLATAGAISTINTLVTIKSVGYTIWVFFDFFAIICLCYNLTRLYPPEKILSLWFWVYRIHVFLLLGQMAMLLLQGRLERVSLWFYEPSYLAIFLSAYFGSALYMFLRFGKPYRLDFCLALLIIFVTASATAIFGMIFSVVLNFLVARQRLKLLLWTAGLGGTFWALLYIFFGDTNYYQGTVGFLFSNGFSFDIVFARGGDRWVRLLIGWGAFLHSPWTGVGIGGDSAYMDAMPPPEFSLAYIQPWTDLVGQPFCNIFVEVLGTMGIVGFIPFVAILVYAGWQAVTLLRDRHPMAPVAMAFMMGYFASLLAMQFEGTMLRYYLWSPLGLAFGVLAQMRQPAIAPAKQSNLLARPALP